ncbi:hypothetical protein CWATWH0005_539 [Crocosphaera watsonii WH 0005]|uniref:Uncharacterized protein n=1 Tax=Crocosphaera watsonii WH 0005 TaxID=423472 RepID=T2IM61_CROWT|nr:hypothetical protein [Crocosphaera watsonii]CCQ54133.1 hypothetical protein CWATWH0005_539 [Crocosphaera watsonii WH 0005]
MFTKLHQVIRSFLVGHNNESFSQENRNIPVNFSDNFSRQWQKTFVIVFTLYCSF